MSEKTQGEELREKLFYQPKNLSETMTPEEKAAAEAFAVPYKAFLDRAKTEREAVTTIVEMLEKAGYVRKIGAAVPHVLPGVVEQVGAGGPLLPQAVAHPLEGVRGQLHQPAICM